MCRKDMSELVERVRGTTAAVMGEMMNNFTN